MSRQEFTKKTKAARFLHCKGICESCGLKILCTPEYDHDMPAALGGDNSFENCRCLCSKCHSAKSFSRDPMRLDSNRSIDRAERLAEKSAGLRKKSGRGFRGHRKFDGTIVWKR